MSREAKPWYRKQTDAWYTDFGGRRILLTRGKANRQQAMDAFYQLMAAKKTPTESELTVAVLCDRFLDWSKLHHSEDTFDWHKRFLQCFCNHHGKMKAVEIVPYHVTVWLDANPTWKGARRHAAYAVKRAFSWAYKEGLLAKHALAGVKIERSGKRERILSREEREQILAAIPDQAFKDFVIELNLPKDCGLTFP
jgi:hypothetical protein